MGLPAVVSTSPATAALQVEEVAKVDVDVAERGVVHQAGDGADAVAADGADPVSYTHLTLPTIYSV